MKYLKVSPYGLGMSCVVLISAIIRLVFISQNFPSTNSDEGTMGLMALHIAYRGAHPIFFYGQNYMGALEAYLGALIFLVVGPSLFALRLGMILLFALFQSVLYRLLSLLYNRRYALIASALLCLGSPELFSRQLRAVGGALETLLFGSLTLLLATSLILTYRSGQETGRRGRMWRYACLGLAMGLGIWSHTLVLPFVGMALLFLFIYCWREWRWLVVLCWLCGLLLGAMPLIIANIQDPAHNAIHTFLKSYQSGGSGAVLPYTVWDQLRGTVLVSVPMATGYSPVCSLNSTPGVWRTEISACFIPQGLWSVVFLVLLATALWSALRSFPLRYLWFWRKDASEAPDEQRCESARLMLLGSGLLTICAFAISSAPALVPLTSARYLVGLEAVLPAVLWPLWQTLLSSGRLFRLNMTSVLSVGILGIIAATFVLGTVISFQQMAENEQSYQQQQHLISDLLAMHATRIYTDYWTCDNIAFLSDERIICAVLGNNLRLGQNRYPPYIAEVQQARPVTYVFLVGSAQAQELDRQMRQGTQRYQITVLDAYIVYREI